MSTSMIPTHLEPSYLEPSLLVYCGFFALLLWRGFCGWRFCGVSLVWTNYCALAYCGLLALTLYAVVRFLSIAYRDSGTPPHPDADLLSIPWLKPFIFGAPSALALVLALCIHQTLSHTRCIFSGRGVWKHDQAIQFIALPAVFGAMMLASMVPVYRLAIGDAPHIGDGLPMLLGSMPQNATAPTGWEERKAVALRRSDDCYFVADVYEAWALYQFGNLTLDLINRSLRKRQAAQNGGRSMSANESQLQELLMTHAAVAELMWLGTFLFILVCLLQAGYALVQQLTGNASDEDVTVQEFEIAGIIASSAAIYNVHIVESSFHHHLGNYRPLLKFVSVKLLVSLAFFQKGVIACFMTLNSWQPSTMQAIIRQVPCVGGIVNMSEVQMRLFYPALLIYECLISAVLHAWAWRADEEWYEDGDAEEAEGEKQRLLRSATSNNPFANP